MKVVIDRDIPFIKGALENYAEVVYLAGNKITRSDLTDADALIVRTRTKCDGRLLEGTTVRCIATATIGYDHIDTEFCRTHNIFWTNAEGCNSSSVQQYMAAALFQLAKKLKFRLADRTIGVVGVGNVGKKVAALCEGIGMKTFLNDPPRARREGHDAFVSLDTIVDRADIISLHVPLNYEGDDRTFHLVDERFLSRLRKDQMLINTSRGEVVETGALKSVLKRKGLAACALDVWEHEPDVDLELLELVDIGTPHIAGYSADGKANGASMSVRSVGRFFGLPAADWRPADIPRPKTATIDVDCANLHQEQILGELVDGTYDILSDDRRLRNSPRTFETQRREYPLRREFPVYTARLRNTTQHVVSLASRMGFNTLTS